MMLGLLTGLLVSAAMGGQIDADIHAALAAHLNGLLGAFWIGLVAWTLPMLSYGEQGKRRLAWAVIVPNYANWLVTAIKSVLKVSGVAYTADPANNGVLIALIALVVLPSLGATAAWLYGFRTRAAAA